MSMKKILGQASLRRALGGAPDPAGNTILKVSAIDVKAKTVTGTVVNGFSKGTEITVRVPENAAKYEDALTVNSLVDKGTKTFIDIENGGTVTFDQIRKGKDGLYTAAWMRTFVAQPNDGTVVHYDALVNINIFTSPGDKDTAPQKYGQISRMLTDQVSYPKTMEDFEAKVMESLTLTGAVGIYGGGDEPYGSITTLNVDGETYTPETLAKGLIAHATSSPERAEATLAALEAGHTAVVPVEVHWIGKKTIAEIFKERDAAAKAGRRGRYSSLDLAACELPSIGSRVHRAITAKRRGEEALPEDTYERMTQAFLKTASDSAKMDFAKSDTFMSVKNEDMRRFFGQEGFHLMDVPADLRGWSRQSLTLGPHKENPDYLIPKKSYATFPNGRAFPPLQIFEEHAKAYIEEILEPIKKIAGVVIVKEAAAEAGAPASAPAADGAKAPSGKAQEAKAATEKAAAAAAPQEVEDDSPAIPMEIDEATLSDLEAIMADVSAHEAAGLSGEADATTGDEPEQSRMTL